MKQNMLQKTGLWLLLLLLFTAFAGECLTSDYAMAAPAPRMSASRKTLSGIGVTGRLTIRNKPKGATYTWFSSDRSVATVNKWGTVTSVKRGKATIRCKITYPSRMTKTLSCAVTVGALSADFIEITNLKDETGLGHAMEVGESYTFKTALQPKTTTDKVFFRVDDDSIVKVNETTGKVTALKSGTTYLYATAAIWKSRAEDSAMFTVVPIQVRNKTSKVTSVEVLGSNKIAVKFSMPIDKRSVISERGEILNAVVSQMTDDSGKVANVPGTLYGDLSSDGMMLTIITQNVLYGKYDVFLPETIMCTNGERIIAKTVSVEYNDTTRPITVSVRNDAVGSGVYIDFNKSIDISTLEVVSVNAGGSDSMQSITRSILTKSANYSLASNQSSIFIDLSGIDSTDYDRAFTVVFKNIRDLSGAYLIPNQVSVTFKIQTGSSQLQAELVSIKKESDGIIAAIFDRPIMIAGSMYIPDIDRTVGGVVDNLNDRKVNYILSDKEKVLSGVINVQISGYCAYNVYGGQGGYAYPNVDFGVAGMVPLLKSSTYVKSNSGSDTIKLTFDKDISMPEYEGILKASLVDKALNQYNNVYLRYGEGDDSDSKSITLEVLENGMFLSGTYTIYLPAGIIIDTQGNPNEYTEFNVIKP